MRLEACQAASGSVTKIHLPSAVPRPAPCVSSDLPEEDQGLQLKWPWALRATPGSGCHTWPGGGGAAWTPAPCRGGGQHPWQSQCVSRVLPSPLQISQWVSTESSTEEETEGSGKMGHLTLGSSFQNQPLTQKSEDVPSALVSA